jgi:SRSO17 transposase
MSASRRFEEYLEHLAAGLGHMDRKVGLKDYCRGLMLPIQRKSVEPLAAYADPLHVSAKHQSLHHFVAQSEWSDAAVMARIRDWVLPHLGLNAGGYWIIDDTGFPKKGKHSVGVARQYCGQLGKQDNCQVAVSLSLASVQGSLPIAYQLYLPKDWADDPIGRGKAGVADNIRFATKPEIALAQMRQAVACGVPMGVVLADAGYGDETAFRDGITELGMRYAVGIRPATTVWAPGASPLPPKPWCGRGIQPIRLRRAPGHEPVAVKALAMDLPPQAYRVATWREGTNTALSSRFAAVRVRAAHRDERRTAMRPEEWLLIEWPDGQAEPTKYFLSTVLADATLEHLGAGVSNETTRSSSRSSASRTTRGGAGGGFITMPPCVSPPMVFSSPSAYARGAPKKTLLQHKRLPYPKITSLAAAGRAQRHVPDSIPTLRLLIARAIANQLQRCPCCGKAPLNL